MTTTNTLSTFAENLDLTPLFNHIKRFTKTDCEFQSQVTSYNGNTYLELQSSNIAEQTGPFSALLDSCRIESAGQVIYNTEKDNEINLWASVHIRYQHKNGGSNGMEITTAWYSPSEGWKFRDAGKQTATADTFFAPELDKESAKKEARKARAKARREAKKAAANTPEALEQKAADKKDMAELQGKHQSMRRARGLK